jgi:RNA recognition motif-containing protein
MFIGGLNWDTTDGTYIIITCSVPFGSTKIRSFVAESLRNYFTQFGKVDACTIMRDAAGRSRCFAFLTFDDPASVNAVMVREHFLDGKIVRTLSYLAQCWSLFIYFYQDRSKKSHTSTRASTRHKTIHRWSRRQRNVRVNARLLLAVWQGH